MKTIRETCLHLSPNINTNQSLLWQLSKTQLPTLLKVNTFLGCNLLQKADDNKQNQAKAEAKAKQAACPYSHLPNSSHHNSLRFPEQPKLTSNTQNNSERSLLRKEEIILKSSTVALHSAIRSSSDTKRMKTPENGPEL